MRGCTGDDPMIRVVTYDLAGLKDLGAVAAVLSRLEPDVVCVLEVPSRRRLRRLASRAGLEVGVRAGGRAAGTAVLIGPRASVRASSAVPLAPRSDGPTRVASHAIVAVEGVRLSVTAVQLGLNPEQRMRDLDELAPFLDGVDALTVVGADLNESVRSPVAAALAERYQDAFGLFGDGPGATYPARDPSTRRDFVLVDRRLPVRAAEAIDDEVTRSAGDHLPVTADLDPSAVATDADE